MSFIKKLQKRWDLSHTYKVWFVLVVFACTGTTVMLMKPYVLGFFEDVDKTLFTILYYILIFPVYNVILLIYGAVFGLFDFFWNFEKRTFKRIFRIK